MIRKYWYYNVHAISLKNCSENVLRRALLGSDLPNKGGLGTIRITEKNIPDLAGRVTLLLYWEIKICVMNSKHIWIISLFPF